jgi:hypothetical protein
MSLDTAKATVILRTLTKTFDNSIQSASPFYPRMANVIPSDGADEAYGMLGAMPGVREWLGDRQFNELRAAQFTIVNKLWESSLLIAKTSLADDRKNLYGQPMQQLAIEAAYHPDELCFAALLLGESVPCFDGQYFFDTDHAWGDSGTQSNDMTYAAATGTTPTAAEFRAAYNAAYARMLSFKGDNGKSFFRPTQGEQIVRPLCMVHVDLLPIATDALNARFDSVGNPITILGNPELIPITYFTDATKFIVMNVSQSAKPVIFQAREPLTRQMKGLEDLETKDVKFMTQARYSAGLFAWWNAVLTTFT